MRPILAIAVLLLGVSSAAPEPEFWSLLPGSFQLEPGASAASLVEIESSIGRGDREALANPPAPPAGEAASDAPPPAATDIQAPAAAAPTTSAPPSADPNPVSAPQPGPDKADSPPQLSVDDLCNALLTSAQDNGLPVAFFANLIWQESRLQNDSVSSKGAVGIAQFMPQTAAQSGLLDPFDPRQAIPASARLLRELRDQFGNLGFAAAAYNAGPRRVSEWLARHITLPRETRGYVAVITGRSVEQWKKAPPSDAALPFARHLPCLDLPAYAELKQTQAQEAQLAQEQQARQAQAAKPQAQELQQAEKAKPKARLGRERLAEHRHPRAPLQREKVATALREHAVARHEAKERVHHAAHERHRSV
jgi:Transglycosylase SLT domain